MLDADFVTIHKLFSESVQFVIPVYQRHYVWNEEEQWAPLWDDIIEKIAVNAKVELDSDRRSHFTGAIVIRNLPRKIGAVPQFEIIDGQQRLTTFQIILRAIVDVCHSEKLNDNKEVAEAYLRNKGLLNDRHDPNRLRDPDQSYKVYPTKADRDSFKMLIDGDISKSRGNIRKSYNFFKKEIDEYIRRGDPRKQIIHLNDSILHNFGLAQILITTRADSEKIFESINARGRTMNEFDHLRNNIFLKARVSAEDNIRSEDKVVELYDNHWQHFEDSYWAKNLGPDAEEMLLSERFIQHFLMAKLGKSSIPHGNLFSVYEREYRSSLPRNWGINLEFRELEKYSKVYRVLLDCKYNLETCREFYPTQRMKFIAQRMEFYKDLNITGVFPFVLYIINELNIPYKDLDKIFDILESYTIRCLLASSRGVRRYNHIFAGAIKRFSKRPLTSIALLDYLSGLEENDRCPNNEAVQSALSQCGEARISRLLTRYILYRIEQFKSASYDTVEEPLRFGDHLTLEHVMPIKWQQYWPLPDRDSSRLENERDRIKESIGNLTLLTKKANKDLGNLSFANKRVPLLMCSNIKITQEIVFEGGDSLKERQRWDVAEIRNREKDLSRYVCEEIWPFMPVYSGELQNWHPSFTNGFIIDARGQTISVHVSEFRASDIAVLRRGTKVQFERVPIQGGFRAVNVVRV